MSENPYKSPKTEGVRGNSRIFFSVVRLLVLFVGSAALFPAGIYIRRIMR